MIAHDYHFSVPMQITDTKKWFWRSDFSQKVNNHTWKGNETFSTLAFNDKKNLEWLQILTWTLVTVLINFNLKERTIAYFGSFRSIKFKKQFCMYSENHIVT